MTIFCGDFETTVPDHEDDSIEEIETRVWAWGVVELDNPNTFTYGTTIDEFIEWCRNARRTIYIHNLKFDGKFLIDYLLRNNFTYDSDRRTDRSFTCLISEYGQYYSIEIVWKVYEKRIDSTIFYDSSKKIPLSISDIAKSFKLPIKKGKINYKKDRPIGYEPTLRELEYLENDVLIMSMALSQQIRQGLNRMTVGSDALFHYKKMVGKKFKDWFPNQFDDKGRMFRDLKLFYRGGHTYVHPKHQGKVIKNGVTYDKNSMYPWVMKTQLLPYGQPIYYQGKYKEEFSDVYPLYCQSISVEFRLKPGHLPTVTDRTGYVFKSIEYIENTKPFQPVILHLTNIELKLFFEHYDIIEIEYIGGYMFKARTGMFDKYIDYWMDVKEKAERDGNSGLRQIAKLMLNSLYGKFGKNIFIGGKIPILDQDVSIVKYHDKPITIEKGVYIPIAIFVTSYARDSMIRSAQSVYDRFVYCDTDSLHLTGLEPPTEIEIDKYKLGAWKDEGAFIRAKYLRAKAYVQEIKKPLKIRFRNKSYLYNKKDLIVKCSGMTPEIKRQVTFENFEFGLTLWGKKQPKTIKGGVLLIETSYTLTA